MKDENQQNDDQGQILYTSFNQDQDCFSCGTEKGYQIFTSFPFKKQIIRENGGIGIVEMNFRTNLLVIVGGGTNPFLPRNKVFLWDDMAQKCVAELSFRSNVKNVKITKEKIIVVLEGRTYIYNFQDLRLIDAVETMNNPRGLVALNPDEKNTVLVTLDKTVGQVVVNQYDKNQSLQIAAHQNPISAMCLNYNGSLLATASEKGTLVRIYSTENGELLQELRRGKDKADIDSIIFDRKSKWVAVTSDRTTIHVFGVKLDQQKEESKGSQQTNIDQTAVRDDFNKANPKSRLSIIKGILPKYFDSEWSYARFIVPNEDKDAKYTCAFGPDSEHIIVVSSNGFYYLAQIPESTGNCKIVEKQKLF